MNVIAVLAVSISLGACAASVPALRSIDETQATVHARGSSMPAYEFTGARWVAGEPLLINSDFDFALAMSSLDFGPGLAAQARLKRNSENAERFHGMRSLALQEQWKAALRARPIENRDRDWLAQQRDAVLYGIVFGAPRAQLRVVLEVGGQRWVWIGATRPLEGADSWSVDRASALIEGFRAAIPELIAMMPLRRVAPSAAPARSYRVIEEGIAPTRTLGWELERKAQRVVLRSQSIPATIYSYPESNLVAGESGATVSQLVPP